MCKTVHSRNGRDKTLNVAPPPSDYQELSIIIPTLNEARSIGVLLNRLATLYPGVSLIVADDNSQDQTAEVVLNVSARLENNKSAKVSFLSREQATERGITASVLEAAQTVCTPYTMVMDGDLQHPPEVVSELYEKLLQETPLVVATRYPHKENQGLHRIAATRFATKLAKRFLFNKGKKVDDPMSGFFGIETKLLKNLIENHATKFEPKGYKILFDLLRLCPEELKIEQVWYHFALREEGSSKLRPWHAFYLLRSFFK